MSEPASQPAVGSDSPDGKQHVKDKGEMCRVTFATRGIEERYQMKATEPRAEKNGTGNRRSGRERR